MFLQHFQAFPTDTSRGFSQFSLRWICPGQPEVSLRNTTWLKLMQEPKFFTITPAQLLSLVSPHAAWKDQRAQTTASSMEKKNPDGPSVFELEKVSPTTLVL